MSIEGILCFFVFPQVEWFMKAGIYAITRTPVKVKAYMQIILMCHKNQLVNLFQNFRIEFVDLIFCNIP